MKVKQQRRRVRGPTSEYGTPIDRPLPRPTRHGITRHTSTRTAAEKPLTLPQEQVLAVMGTGLRSPSEIGREIGRSRSSVTSSLFALQDRGLVERIPGKGWQAT